MTAGSGPVCPCAEGHTATPAAATRQGPVRAENREHLVESLLLRECLDQLDQPTVAPLARGKQQALIVLVFIDTQAFQHVSRLGSCSRGDEFDSERVPSGVTQNADKRVDVSHRELAARGSKQDTGMLPGAYYASSRSSCPASGVSVRLSRVTCQTRPIVRPFIEDQPLRAITPENLEHLYTELLRCRDHCPPRPDPGHLCRTLHPNTVRNLHYLLSSAFRRAACWN